MEAIFVALNWQQHIASSETNKLQTLLVPRYIFKILFLAELLLAQHKQTIGEVT